MTPVPWRDFAVKLFEIEDADPGYLCLARAHLPTSQKMRLVVGWATYYNLGIAAYASQLTGRAFWQYLFSQYKTAQRASERRHFRGAAGLKALRAWEQQFPQPERMIEYAFGETYFDVKRKTATLAQMGTYFTWKLADVQERVFHIPCDFTGAEKHSPKVPQEGARMIAPEASVVDTYAAIVAHFAKHKLTAPPDYDRPMNMQEAETVCCIYHQMIGGGYWWHSRTAKAIMRLSKTPCPTSTELIDCFDRGPYSVPWAQQILTEEPA